MANLKPPASLPIPRPPFPPEIANLPDPDEWKQKGGNILDWAHRCARIQDAQRDWLCEPFTDKAYVEKLAEDFRERFGDDIEVEVEVYSNPYRTGQTWELELTIKRCDPRKNANYFLSCQSAYEQWFEGIERDGLWWKAYQV